MRAFGLLSVCLLLGCDPDSLPDVPDTAAPPLPDAALPDAALPPDAAPPGPARVAWQLTAAGQPEGCDASWYVIVTIDGTRHRQTPCVDGGVDVDVAPGAHVVQASVYRILVEDPTPDIEWVLLGASAPATMGDAHGEVTVAIETAVGTARARWNVSPSSPCEPGFTVGVQAMLDGEVTDLGVAECPAGTHTGDLTLPIPLGSYEARVALFADGAFVDASAWRAGTVRHGGDLLDLGIVRLVAIVDE